MSSVTLNAQDYIIESVEHLPTDMTARTHIKKDGMGRDCAVLRFATQGIAAEKRDDFYFQPDFGSDVVEKSLQNGEIWVWVSPNIKVLRVMHGELGSYELHFTKHLAEPVLELHTYKVLLKAVVPPPPPVMQYNYMIVKADQPDAAISFDGQFVNMGEASKSFKVGETHTWSIECELYHTESGSATIVKDNAVTVEKTLRPAFGYINVTSTPENGANVFVDNKFVGTTPFRTDRIASGEHKVRVMKEMYSTAEKTVTVTDGNTTQAAIALSANFVNATVTTDPDSDIYIDSELKGKGRWTGRLPDGEHTFEARKASHRSSFKNVTLTLGRDEDVSIPNPTPIYGTLDVNSDPMEAAVIIDGVRRGETPAIISDILIGTHELRLVKQGCAPFVKTITIEEGKMTEVSEKLDSGKTITITTGRSGDEIYVDGVSVGVSPLETAMGYGTHKVKAVRDGRKVEKEINVQIDGGSTNLTLEFGKIIRITTDRDGDVIYVDGKPAGSSPLDIDLTFGNHDIKSVRDKKSDERRINVQREGASTVSLYLRAETPANWVRNGVFFVTANGAMMNTGLMSYGLTVGSVKEAGWFVSVMSNFNFGKADADSDGDGFVNGIYPAYTMSKDTRLSIIGGVVIKLDGPVCMRIGAGYGKKEKLWNTEGGKLVKYGGESYSGVDTSLGLQLNIKGLTVSLDAVTTNFKTLEAKIGIGCCIRKK